MLAFECDYLEGAHEKILNRLIETNMEKLPGYGADPYCASAREKILDACQCPEGEVFFLVGGTQTNATVIAAALRPYQGVLCAASAHINGHETGAVEAAGHKCLTLPGHEGKITGEQVRQAVLAHRNDPSFAHMVQPAMVYISQSTELGTLYSRRELEELSDACRELGLSLFLDGARLGYALASESNDLTLADIARLCDVFYIGGTKVGALFGEAVVIGNPEYNRDFRYMIKRQGGMLAKGRLLGLQFGVLMEDGLYFRLAEHADRLADRLRDTLENLGVPFLVPGVTNQLFPILPDGVLAALSEKYVFCEQQRMDESHRAVRFCTSWATREEAVDALCADLRRLLGGENGNPQRARPSRQTLL